MSFLSLDTGKMYNINERYISRMRIYRFKVSHKMSREVRSIVCGLNSKALARLCWPV